MARRVVSVGLAAIGLAFAQAAGGTGLEEWSAKPRSWLVSFNLPSAVLATVDMAVEYVPSESSRSLVFRVWRSLGYVNDWSSLGLGGCYRVYPRGDPPWGLHLGFGGHVASLDSFGGSGILYAGPKVELGYNMMLKNGLCVVLGGEVFCYASTDGSDEGYSGVSWLGSTYPSDGLAFGLILGLGFAR